ncbi:MAG: glycosyltransferase family 39 protein, partial [bacterium]|nr:glycosyltransferase family 39 protein [Candidatus Kapabacteria bacterium]
MKRIHIAWTALALACAAFIAPTIALPLGPDSSMFYVSAQKILHQGAIHYRDIVELKPPPIYYMYALALVFSESATSIRVLDILLQLMTCVGIVMLIRRVGGSNAWAATSALIYAAMYGGLGYAYTMECESYVGLLVVGMAWMMLVSRTRTSFVIAGALAGAAALLKFPFGIVIGAIVMCELAITRVTMRGAAANIALALAGFAAMIA